MTVRLPGGTSSLVIHIPPVTAFLLVSKASRSPLMPSFERQSPLTPPRGRGFDCGLREELSWRIELAAGQVLRSTPCSLLFFRWSLSAPSAIRAECPASEAHGPTRYYQPGKSNDHRSRPSERDERSTERLANRKPSARVHRACRSQAGSNTRCNLPRRTRTNP